MSAALERLSLRDRHLQAGARMVPFAGWEMPLRYQGIVAEHRAVRGAAGIFDVSHMGRVRVTGTEAAGHIRSVTTYDVTQLASGQMHYSLYCNEQGGIDDDVMVARLAEDRWLIVHNAANAEADAARVAAAAGSAAEDVGRSTVMLAVQGPQAVEAVEQVIGPHLSALEPRACIEVDWRGSTLLLSRSGYTGEDGAEIVTDPDPGGALWDAFTAAGVLPAGLGARDTLRLEAALPLHGHDLTSETTPYDARLGWAVSLDDQAGFTGRAALQHLAPRDPQHRLAHLRLLDRGVPREGYRVLDEAGEPVGTLSSGAFSPTLGVGIGMGYLPAALTQPGTRLAVEVRQHRIPAEVVRRPFYRRPLEGRQRNGKA